MLRLSAGSRQLFICNAFGARRPRCGGRRRSRGAARSANATRPRPCAAHAARLVPPGADAVPASASFVRGGTDSVQHPRG